MSIGLLWVALAALLFGAGSLAQAAALARPGVPAATPRPGLRDGLLNPLFLLGTAAEGLGALAHVVALQSTSLALAQTAVTGSLAVTALGARVLWGQRLGRAGVAAVGGLGVSLAALAAVSGDGSGSLADPDTAVVVLAAATGALVLAAATAPVLAARLRGPAFAVVSGLAFAVYSIAARLVHVTRVVATLTEPALGVLAVAATVGAVAWTLALRDAGVTTVTAVVVLAEVVPPSLLAPLLGDEVGSSFPLVAPLALAAAAAAGVVLARRDPAAVPAPGPAGTAPRAVGAGARPTVGV